MLFRKLDKRSVGRLGWSHEKTYFTGDVVAVGSCDNGVFVKDVVYELRGNANFDFSTFDGFRAWVDKLAGFAFALILCGCLSKDQMLKMLCE